MSGYDFRWVMSDERFHRMKDTISNTGAGDECCFGNVYFGNYCADIVLAGHDGGVCVRLDFYHIGVDSGYGYTKKGTPYDFEDGLCGTIRVEDVAGMGVEKFKREAEEVIAKEISSKNFSGDFMEKEVQCPLADWE